MTSREDTDANHRGTLRLQQPLLQNSVAEDEINDKKQRHDAMIVTIVPSTHHDDDAENAFVVNKDSTQTKEQDFQDFLTFVNEMTGLQTTFGLSKTQLQGLLFLFAVLCTSVLCSVEIAFLPCLAMGAIVLAVARLAHVRGDGASIVLWMLLVTTFVVAMTTSIWFAMVVSSIIGLILFKEQYKWIAASLGTHGKAFLARHGWRRILLSVAVLRHIVCQSLVHSSYGWGHVLIVVAMAMLFGGKRTKQKTQQDNTVDENGPDTALLEEHKQSTSPPQHHKQNVSDDPSLVYYLKGLVMTIATVLLVHDYYDYYDSYMYDYNGKPLVLCIPLFLVLLQVFWEMIDSAQDAYEQQNQSSIRSCDHVGQGSSTRFQKERMFLLHSPLGRACLATVLIVLFLCGRSIVWSMSPDPGNMPMDPDVRNLLVGGTTRFATRGFPLPLPH